MALKTYWIGYLLVCVVCLPAFTQSQAQSYQAATIVKVEQLPDTGSTRGTDAPMKSAVHDYNASMQVGDTVYVCHYHAHNGQESSWLQGLEGKDAQVRIKGKVMYVKRATGKDEKATIVNTTKASQP
jgi:hypothetical protein